MTIPRPWPAVALAAPPLRPLAAQETPAEKPVDEPAKTRAEKPGEKARGNPPGSAGADGFVIPSENGDYRLRIGGYTQADGRFHLGDKGKPGTDPLLLGCARVLVVGTAAERFEVYLVPDFGGGALELVARVHQLKVGDEAVALGFADITKAVRKAGAWAIGLNGYLNRNVKCVLNDEQTPFEGGAALGDRPREKAILARAQIYF